MAIWDDVVPVADREAYGKYTQLASVGMGRRPVILVVDMTASFIDERYSTGCGPPARDAVIATASLLDCARNVDVPRIFAVWEAGALPEEIGYWKCQHPRVVGGDTSDLPHPNSLPPELGARKDELVVARSKASAFFGSNLAGILAFHRADTVVVAGISTSGCVRATVVDAFSLNYRVIIPEECVADRVIVPHKVNLFDMHMKYADVLPLKSVIAQLHAIPRMATDDTSAAERDVDFITKNSVF
jgi:maleamate amidohydrolase